MCVKKNTSKDMEYNRPFSDGYDDDNDVDEKRSE